MNAMVSRRIVLPVLVLGAFAARIPGRAAAQTITEFPVPSSGRPVNIAPGPGGMWFTEQASRIGRITLDGHVSEFPVNRPARAIVAGLDGNLWFTSAGFLSRMTAGGAVTDFPTLGDGWGITVGPDGNIWFTEIDRNGVGYLGRATAAGEITERRVGAWAESIIAGPDGNFWLPDWTEVGGDAIVRVTPSGIETRFPLPGGLNAPGDVGPAAVAVGSDGNIWFTEVRTAQIGRITPSGGIRVFNAPGGFGLAAGADGNLWFTEHQGARIGRITTSGVVTEIPISSPAFGIAAGPDGNVWFTEPTGKIGRVTLGPAPVLDSRILPVVGSTPGAGGSFFRTSVQLHNATASPMTGRVVFRPSGLSGTDSDPALSYSLSPGQTQSIADLLPAMGRSGLGSADIEATSGSVPAMTARVFNDAGAAGTTGFTEDPMRAEDALSPTESGILILPADLARFRFNLGVRTLEETTATLTVRDASGTVAVTVSRALPATYHEQQSASAFLEFEALPAGGSIAISVTSGSAIFYGAIVDNTTGDPSLQVARPAQQQ